MKPQIAYQLLTIIEYEDFPTFQSYVCERLFSMDGKIWQTTNFVKVLNNQEKEKNLVFPISNGESLCNMKNFQSKPN